MFRPLGRNWDSYGAEPVTQETCDLANRMVECMNSLGLTRSTAGPNGSIVFFDEDERQMVTVEPVGESEEKR